ncbi:Tyrosine recombinase XerC [Achromobacter xylosoxidans]|uniref:tyrosine-type recombinase/integrase n=1 Tax=Achromobacter TaxID=222 RepID=UPI0006C0FB2A|nr:MULTISPECIES: site-specific integrase [Achromobacter]CAB3920277.1 Tyrosine recombinase XerD [Achromobacter insuavis]CUJ32350.1 Tyrosine recombinase XerC [Achromobacter xylosoxidans]CUJ40759.1 Tyrosine recombinase XerC [Achromobacter sp. 2789STDY5608621]
MTSTNQLPTSASSSIDQPVHVQATQISGPAHSHILGPVCNDWDAAEVWLTTLAARPVSPATVSTYRREVRRLRWYCKLVGAAQPTHWNLQDANGYIAFLNKQPARFPCPPHAEYGAPDWTPFRSGKFGPTAIAAASRILGTMFTFWQQAGYVRANPFATIKLKSPQRGGPGARHAIPAQALAIVRKCMDDRTKRTARDHLVYWRNAFLLVLIERTGLRADEVAGADMADIFSFSDPQNARLYWGMTVRKQKGGREGRVVLDATVVKALMNYRRAFGLADMPQPGEEQALILSPQTAAAEDDMKYQSARGRRGRGMWLAVRSRQNIWAIVRKEFDAAAKAQTAGSPVAVLLKRASTHWLRHTYGTALALQGAHPRVIAEALRHADMATSMVYTNLDLLEVARALEDRPR